MFPASGRAPILGPERLVDRSSRAPGPVGRPRRRVVGVQAEPVLVANFYALGPSSSSTGMGTPAQVADAWVTGVLPLFDIQTIRQSEQRAQEAPTSPSRQPSSGSSCPVAPRWRGPMIRPPITR